MKSIDGIKESRSQIRQKKGAQMKTCSDRLYTTINAHAFSKLIQCV